MALTAGIRLGPYEIRDQIGAGGMGEVYRATDTRLDRTVAIKVLPEHLASDPQRRERFEREARAVSSLNHPHICTLHDVGEQDGIHYLVMEYVEGDTLQQRLEKGRLPLDQALQYAIQIADALDKAHRQGVVHRDLKPGNIMITKSGTKLLDFGLAKLKGDAGGVSPLSQMPTQDASAPLTAEGTILGTLQYMAPEQLEGKEADNRTDIFAFGAVVYEMVTGKKAFEGANPASLIAAILEREPTPMAELQSVAPPALDRLVRRLLAKDPEDRWQTTRDIVIELNQIPDQTDTVTIAKIDRRGIKVAWSIAAATTVIAVLLLLARLYAPALENRLVAFSIPTELGGSTLDITVSPDGSKIAYLGAQQAVLIRSLGEVESRPVPGTEGARVPIWSPDGESIAFFADGQLKRTDVTGGTVISLCPDPVRQRGGSWNDAGQIVFSGGDGPIYVVPDTGGTPQPVTTIDEASGETAHLYPQFLPGGRRFLYMSIRSGESGGTHFVATLDGGDPPIRVLALPYGAKYAQGNLFFMMEDGILMTQPFDLDTLQMTGRPTAIAEDVGASSGLNTGFSVSENGVLAYRRILPRTTETNVVWVRRDGSHLETVSERRDYGNTVLSPDETKIAFDLNRQRNEGELGTLELASGKDVLIQSSTNDMNAFWSPEGRRLVYTQGRRDGTWALAIRSTETNEPPEVIHESGNFVAPTDWSRDGRYIIFEENNQGNWDLWAVPTFGDRVPVPLLTESYWETQGKVSPNGQWIAYASNEGGGSAGFFEVYLQRFPSLVGKQKVSVNTGRHPIWRKDGRELFFISVPATNYDELMSVTVAGGAPLVLGDPQPWFRLNVPTGEYGNVLSVASEGDRFLVSALPESFEPDIRVVLNWQQFLTQ